MLHVILSKAGRVLLSAVSTGSLHRK